MTWTHVGVLLDVLDTRGTSDDETDNDLEHRNPDSRFKTVRRVDTGFLNPAIAEIWASVESYPSSFRPSRGNRSFKRIPQARSINKKRTPMEGLPINYYNPRWFEGAPPLFRDQAKAEVPLPTLVSQVWLSHSYIRHELQVLLHCVGPLQRRQHDGALVQA